MTEVWRPVVGYEGIYSVSSLGQVKSLARTVRVGRGSRQLSERMLRWRTDDASTGYVYVSLCRDGEERKVPVHLLVLAAFVGPSNGLWGLHKDGDRANPALTNLYYGTPKQNSQDMVRHGKSARGRRNPNAVLSDELVQWVRESPQSSICLGLLLDVHHSTIRAARTRRNWSHV